MEIYSKKLKKMVKVSSSKEMLKIIDQNVEYDMKKMNEDLEEVKRKIRKGEL